MRIEILILLETKFPTTSGAARDATWGAPCDTARGGASDETTAADDDTGADAGVLRDRLLILLWQRTTTLINTHSENINTQHEEPNVII